MKRILIFYTSIGLGHKIIAENIGWHLQQAGYEVKLSDILEVQSGFLVDVGKWLHSFINTRLPFVWKFLYTSQGFNKLTLGLRVPLAGKNSGRAQKAIEEFNPDLVIATQTTGSAIVSYLKRQGIYKNKFAIAFSDYHLHPYWLYKEADLYLSNIPEQKTEMVQQGIPENKIVVAGITLQPHPEVDVAEVRGRLGLTEGDQAVLMASGSLGTGVSPEWTLDFVQQLAKVSPKARAIIVCGKNEALRAELSELLKGTSALVFGYYKPMSELYAVSEIFVTKPGGLSVAESLSWALPLLITHWLPGQEELNYTYLSEKNLIMPVSVHSKVAELADIVGSELATHNFKQSLSQNAAWNDLIQEKRLGQAIKTAVSQLLN